MDRTLPASWVEKIFRRMQGYYGSIWVDRWKSGESQQTPQGLVDVGMLNAKVVWAEELGGFSDTPEAIGKALDACKGLKFPPTLPEFLALCREEAGRPKPAKQIEYTPTAEDRQRQQDAAERIAQEARAKQARCFDGLAWARTASSPYALQALAQEAAAENPVLGPIFREHVAAGRCDEHGNPIKQYRRAA